MKKTICLALILCSVLLISGCSSDNITGGAVTNVDQSKDQVIQTQEQVQENSVVVSTECDSTNPCPEGISCHKGKCVQRCWNLGSEHD